jgi:ABC-type transport system involved in multi-copper enzyme maturation permease subunit
VTRQLRSELLKLRTTRTFWLLIGITAGLVVLITVLTLALDTQLETTADTRAVLSTAGASGLMLLILGIVFAAGEYRHGTIAWTLLVTPDRLRVAAGQALACAIAGAAIGAGIAALTAVVALPWLAAKDAPALSGGEAIGLFAGGVLYTALAAALGAGVGALLRNQAAAIVLLLVILFVIDPVVTALVEDYGRYSLSGLGAALIGGTADEAGVNELPPFWLAALLWAGYTTLLVSAAAVLTSRRDI